MSKRNISQKSNVQQMKIEQIPTIETDSGPHYDTKTIDEYMKEHKLIKPFSKYIAGTTGGITGNGTYYYYRWDIHLFLEKINKENKNKALYD